MARVKSLLSSSASAFHHVMCNVHHVMCIAIHHKSRHSFYWVVALLAADSDTSCLILSHLSCTTTTCHMSYCHMSWAPFIIWVLPLHSRSFVLFQERSSGCSTTTSLRYPSEARITCAKSLWFIFTTFSSFTE